jgi:hypothetical protein
MLMGADSDEVPLLELATALRSFARRIRTAAHRLSSSSRRQILFHHADVADAQAADLEKLARNCQYASQYTQPDTMETPPSAPTLQAYARKQEPSST